MRDVLIRLAHINKAVVGQDDEDHNGTEDYVSKDYIMCDEQGKDVI